MPKDVDAVDLSIGQRIRAFRLSRGMSQSELGSRIGVTFQQIQKYERGANRIGGGRLKKIAAALDAPITALFGEDKIGSATADNRLAAILSQPYAVRLLLAFDDVKGTTQRRALVHFVECMGRAAR